MIHPSRLPRRRHTTATLLAAALAAPAPWAHAIDWDGDFPTDGNYDGKIENPDNWDFNILPGPSDGASFLATGTYTVAFGVDFETGGGDVSNGNVTFQSIGISTQTYAISGVLNINSSLTLDAVDFAQGSLNNFSVRVRNGGTLTMMNGNLGFSNTLEVGSSTTDGSVTIDNTGFQTETLQIMGAGGSGASLTVQNNAQLDIAGGALANLLMGRFNNYDSHLEVLGGSSVTIGNNLLMSNIDGNTGNAEVMLSGAGSSLSVGGDAEIGSDSISTAAFTLGAGTAADFDGALRVGLLGDLTNNGGAVTVDGAAQVDGRFEQTGGSTVFGGTAGFGTGAAFVHFGGSLQFQDATSFAFQDITIGGPSVPNAATWDVDADVAYNRRLRLAGDTGTHASVTVADTGGTSVPEPATLAILSIALLAAPRRRHDPARLTPPPGRDTMPDQTSLRGRAVW